MGGGSGGGGGGGGSSSSGGGVQRSELVSRQAGWPCNTQVVETNESLRTGSLGYQPSTEYDASTYQVDVLALLSMLPIVCAGKPLSESVKDKIFPKHI